MSMNQNGDRRAGIACPRFIGQIVTVLCLVALAVIVRPLLRGLAVVAADIVTVVVLVIVIYVMLWKGRRRNSRAAIPPAEDKPKDEPRERVLDVCHPPTRFGGAKTASPPRSEAPSSTASGAHTRDRSAEIEDELQEIKRKLGKDQE